MGGEGTMLHMILSNKSNLGMRRRKKFSSKGGLLAIGGSEEEGYTFKTPDPVEVESVRKRIARERQIDRVKGMIATVIGILIWAYLFNFFP